MSWTNDRVYEMMFGNETNDVSEEEQKKCREDFIRWVNEIKEERKLFEEFRRSRFLEQ